MTLCIYAAFLSILTLNTYIIILITLKAFLNAANSII